MRLPGRCWGWGGTSGTGSPLGETPWQKRELKEGLFLITAKPGADLVALCIFPSHED